MAVVAQRPLVFFGNGYWARCLKEFPAYTDKDGKKRKKLRLAISETIKEEYNIKEGTMLGDYPAKKIVTLSNEYTHPCIFIFCGVRGEKTDFENYYSELLKTIEVYERNEQSDKTTIVKLLEENDDLKTIHEKHLKKIANIVRLLDKKGEKKEEEEESESA